MHAIKSWQVVLGFSGNTSFTVCNLLKEFLVFYLLLLLTVMHWDAKWIVLEVMIKRTNYEKSYILNV